MIIWNFIVPVLTDQRPIIAWPCRYLLVLVCGHMFTWCQPFFYVTLISDINVDFQWWLMIFIYIGGWLKHKYANISYKWFSSWLLWRLLVSCTWWFWLAKTTQVLLKIIWSALHLSQQQKRRLVFSQELLGTQERPNMHPFKCVYIHIPNSMRRIHTKVLVLVEGL